MRRRRQAGARVGQTLESGRFYPDVLKHVHGRDQQRQLPVTMHSGGSRCLDPAIDPQPNFFVQEVFNLDWRLVPGFGGRAHPDWAFKD